jgi:Na+-driven multidrug efflux pump
MPTYRIEHDSMGEMRVPADALWGAQTQRSLENFPIGTETMPDEIISAFIREEEVVRMGARALRLTSCFYFFLGVIYVTRGTLNGIGDALFALINGVVEMICRIFLPTLLVLLPGVGVWGIWWTAGLTWLISAVFCCLRYFAWRRKTFGKGGGASKTAEGTA